MLAGMELTVFDIALPIACMVGGFFGSLSQAIAASISPHGPPVNIGELQIASPELQESRGAWLAMRLFLGVVLGFVFALYFVGSLNETPGTFARIWALSFIVGYAAPKIWIEKEEAMLRYLRAATARALKEEKE